MAKRKPRGNIGYIVLGPDPKFCAVSLPDSKEEIEGWILERAVTAAASTPGESAPYDRRMVRNPENHFDFTIEAPQGLEYLDLMEIVILPKGARGYEGGSPSYDAEDMAEAVFQKVAAKSKHYHGPRVPVHLLLYATDWRFRLVEEVKRHLELRLARRKHVFATICFFAPESADQGEFSCLYPLAADQIETRARELYEKQSRGSRTWVMSMDPRQGKQDGPNRVIFPNPGMPRSWPNR